MLNLPKTKNKKKKKKKKKKKEKVKDHHVKENERRKCM
jgi:hypothetical protein